MAKMLGYEPGEMVGRSVFDFYFPQDVEDKKRVLMRRKQGVREEREERLRRRDGSELRVRMAATPVTKDNGEFDGALAMMSDITERKRAEEALRESEEKFRSVFRDAGVGMVIVSPEGRYLAANRTFCDYLGYTEKELLDKTVQSVTFAEDWPSFSQRLNETIIGGRGFHRFEKRCLHKSGRVVCTESTASLIRSREGKPQYFVGEVLDVTNRKQAEAALSNINRRLIEAQEQERMRIGRELHDDVSQRLAMLGS
jgi:PAS domain S-box-containing protein